jgi:hypothetical protein
MSKKAAPAMPRGWCGMLPVNPDRRCFLRSAEVRKFMLEPPIDEDGNRSVAGLAFRTQAGVTCSGGALPLHLDLADLLVGHRPCGAKQELSCAEHAVAQ